MEYQGIVKGKFLSRPNRFIAEVEVNGSLERAHVKNIGRCRELLIEGVPVYLEDFNGRMGSRKMRYSLIGVEKSGLMINMDSQAPNKVVEEALECGKIKLQGIDEIKLVKREVKFGNSRFDFYIEGTKGEKAFIEVKGVTLESEGHTYFPDAPTERGLKHIYELIEVTKEGLLGFVIFVIQINGVLDFSPNYETHPEFGKALVEARNNGVEIYAYDCIVGESSLEIDKKIPVSL